MYCSNCACELPAVAKFCVRCGSRIELLREPQVSQAEIMPSPPVEEPKTLEATKSVKTNWIWPHIRDEGSAKEAVRAGALCSAFVAGVTGLLSLLAMVNGKAIAGIDGGGLVDASLFALISWRLYRYSFWWAATGLVLILSELVWKITTYPRGIGIITFLIILGFLHAVRGTYFLRNERKKQVAPSSLTA